VAEGPAVLSQGAVPGSPLLILCIFGTHPQPFDRALDWLVEAAGEEDLIVQHGATARRDGLPRIQWHELLPYDDLVELIAVADVIVCHAGVGSLMSVIDHGRRPIAIARQRQFGEHVDDHQLQIASELDQRGYVIACSDPQRLHEALESAHGAVAVLGEPSGDLREAAITAAGGALRAD
jgi:UDP-N-acetylglucosamine--N-acetylmuramyl-(pentapeptide) pyrophosphoryl-undecaprenol N-acetylglucosamine transferase